MERPEDYHYQRLDTVDVQQMLIELNHNKKLEKEKSLGQNLLSNWKSGFTLSLVNLPLCISLAVASKATPTIGILSGIVGGLVSSLFGGSNYNVIGPTGALSGFLSVAVGKYGMSSLPYFAIITAIFTFISKLYHLEKYIDLIPGAVKKGFTVGVALILFINQMNSALGIGIIKEIENVDPDINQFGKVTKVVEQHTDQTVIQNLIKNLRHIDQINIQAFLIFLIFFISMLFLLKKIPSFPWMMMFTAIGIFIGIKGYFNIETLGSRYSDISFKLFDFSYLSITPPSILLTPEIWLDAIAIAFVALLETLISAKIADSMTNTSFDKSNEIRGLCLSNLISGLLGGMPITAALARTALNIESGATNKLSAGLNSCIMILLGAFFISYFSYLPMAVIAAQVCIVAVRMVNYEKIYYMYLHDKNNFFILLIIACICIIRDPTFGIIFGMLIYLVSFCENLTVPWTEMIISKNRGNEQHEITEEGKIDKHCFYNSLLCDIPKEDGNYIIYRIVGILTFMNVNHHIEKIKLLAQKQDTTVVISLKYMHFIDVEAIRVLRHLAEAVDKSLHSKGENKRFIISGITVGQLGKFHDNEWINKMKDDGCIIFNHK